MRGLSKARILLAEDNAVLANAVRVSLESAGYTVCVAENGQEAWEKAQYEMFDLVLTDEIMPIMAGRELCKLLRNDNRYLDTPIIFITATTLDPDLLHDKEVLRVTEVVPKPFRPSDLRKAVAAALAERKAVSFVRTAP